MDPLPIIALAAIGTLYGLAWHNQPSRTESGISGDDAVPSKVGVDWAMLAIWGCVVLSFAAFFFAGYIVWVKCHSDWPY